MIETRILKNGITLIMEEMEGYRSVSLGVWVKAGSDFETEKTNGMAHVIEHMHFKGTSTRSARDLADQMTRMGGGMDAFTTKEYTCYYAKILEKNLQPAMEIFSDMLLHSSFDEEDFHKELGVICEEIDMYDDSPDDAVWEQLQKRVWKDQPAGYLISGQKDVVRSFQVKDVLRFKEKFYNGNRMVISIAGNFKADEAAQAAEKYFGALPAGSPAFGLTPDRKPAVWHPSLYLRNRNLEQVHMILSFEGADYYDENRYTLTLLGSIFGGNSNSRLFQKIRESLGLVYTIYSFSSAGENSGSFQIYAAMQPSQVFRVMDAVIEQVLLMKREEVSRRELDIAREQIETDLIIEQESTYSRMIFCGREKIHGLEPVPLSKSLEKLDAVTPEDIRSYMNRHFDLGSLSLSLVGDLSSLPEQKIRDHLEACRRIG